MPNTKHSPGIHLFKRHYFVRDNKYFWYWHIISRNGREIARSSETYTRKANAVKSIKVAASIFKNGMSAHAFYDHSVKDSPLKSYL